MKSKLIISSIVLAVLVSFAFISIDKDERKSNEDNKIAQQKPASGITLEDSSF